MLVVLAARVLRAGAPDSTVPMPVLACTAGASIENNDVCIVCIGACIGLY